MARKGLNIYKRKDGRWEARYIKSRNTQGKPRYGYLYATSYHEARNNLQKVIQALNATDNEKVPATNYKFMDFSVIWLENPLTSLKESTYIRYRTLLNCYLMPSFQKLQMSEITSERVCTLCKELEKHGKKDGTGLSPKTISDIDVERTVPLGSRHIAENQLGQLLLLGVVPDAQDVVDAGI